MTEKQIKETSSARVYRTLRDEILRVEIPPGAPFDEVKLGERFGMSRSPVREALARLSSEGLVTLLPNCSTVVTPMDLQKVPQFLDALDLLQRVMTSLAATHRTTCDLNEIVRQQKLYEEAIAHSIETGNSVPMIEQNYNFHMAIAVAGRNSYLADPYRRLLQEGRRMLHLHFEYESQGSITVEKMAADHTVMVDAITRKDVAEAERIAHVHAMQFKGHFMQYLDRNLTAKIAVEYDEA